MRYRAFQNYHIGYSHVRKGAGCEDYAASYTDPDGQFLIAVACDGHSDKNCFRSARGAKFGCEAGVETLRRFFKLFLSNVPEDIPGVLNGSKERLKQSIKQCWDDKVYADLKNDPFTEADLAPLSERSRLIYQQGKSLTTIYGATFLAVGICRHFFIALHIGDGILLAVSPSGTYYAPLPRDKRSESGSPESLCDNDLISRPDAFRCEFRMQDDLPFAAVASSDGIIDCMDELTYREQVADVLNKLGELEEPDQPQESLNERQDAFLGNFVSYWADKGRGAEDDCSFAGFYLTGCRVPAVSIPESMTRELWQSTLSDYELTFRDYESRKKATVENIQKQQITVKNAANNTAAWLKEKEYLEALIKTLHTMEQNESEKLSYLKNRLKIVAGYIERNGCKAPIPRLPQPTPVRAQFPLDSEFENVRQAMRTAGQNTADKTAADNRGAEPVAEKPNTDFVRIDPDEAFPEPNARRQDSDTDVPSPDAAQTSAEPNDPSAQTQTAAVTDADSEPASDTQPDAEPSKAPASTGNEVKS